jgi:hypothetical protein
VNARNWSPNRLVITIDDRYTPGTLAAMTTDLLALNVHCVMSWNARGGSNIDIAHQAAQLVVDATNLDVRAVYDAHRPALQYQIATRDLPPMGGAA